LGSVEQLCGLRAHNLNMEEIKRVGIKVEMEVVCLLRRTLKPRCSTNSTWI